MGSSQITSLFSERPPANQKPYSFMVSIAAHCSAIGLIAFGLVFTPKVRDKNQDERFTVRHLDLHVPDPEEMRKVEKSSDYPSPVNNEHKPSPGGSQAVLRQIAHADPGKQTLIQPDLPKVIKLKEETPVPTVVIWSPKKNVVKSLIAPAPEKATAADVRPANDPPNQEVNLADMSVSSSNLVAPTHAIAPSTTSPVVVHGPQAAQLPPVTTSVSNATPTPTAVLSLSDVRMTEGTITLPPVNETASISSPGAFMPGPAVDPSKVGSGNPESKATGVGAGTSAGDPKTHAGAAGKPGGVKAAVTNRGDDDGSNTGVQASTNQITLPQNGQYDSVLIGASLEEKYPEAAKVWSGRMAYTVYLHVGLSKSWILQYSLPRAADAASAGSISHLDAPWPFNIVRPNLPADTINADALMVHGFVNQAGRFETLAVAFPPEFAQTQFVLDALRQWQFRPAVQNGQKQRVEVLLIIPEELE